MKTKNYVISLLKLFCSLIIVGLHSVYLLDDGVRHIFPHGYLCVELFFIISGLFMAKNAFTNGNDSNDSFMARKIKRLLPYIIVAWIINATILIVIHPERGVSENFSHLVSSVWQLLMLEVAGFNGFQVIDAFWYLSASFLTMPILYYLITKKGLYTKGGDILLSVFIYGWFLKKYGLIVNASGEYYQITTLFRAIAGMSLGCFCYRIAKQLLQYDFTRAGSLFLTILECIGYIISFVIICRPWTGKGDTVTFFILIAWTISIPITYSQKSYSDKINNLKNEKLMEYLSSLSIALYLCHGRMQGFVNYVFPSLTSFKEKIIPYYVLSILAGV